MMEEQQVEDELNIIKANMSDMAGALLDKELTGLLGEDKIKQLRAMIE